jgi:hypothetical protein
MEIDGCRPINYLIDIKKISVRQGIERIVRNYFLMGAITEEQSNSICHCVNKTIGGGDFPQPVQVRGCSVIPFPTTYTGRPQLSAETKPKQEEKPQEPPQSKPEYYAPYGVPLPEGVEDFRETLQRNGLVLICYKKYQDSKGILFDILWAQSCPLLKRIAYWSGTIRQEDIPYAMPITNNIKAQLPRDATLLYTVNVAPEGIDDAPLSEYRAYIQSLKDSGMKNDFDYLFSIREQEHQRFLIKNKELLDIKLPSRVIRVLNDKDIYTIEGLKKLTVQELRETYSMGEKNVSEAIAALKQAGITLSEKTEV